MKLYVSPASTDYSDSWTKTAKNLQTLLDRLERVNANVISGDIVQDCYELKRKIVYNLHIEGWTVSKEGNKYTIQHPGEKK